MNERAIHFLPHPAVLAIHHVVDLHATRQRGTLQVPQHVIGVARRLAYDRIVLGEEFPVGRIGQLQVAVLREAILRVIRAVHGAGRVCVTQPVAVAVVGVVPHDRAVLGDIREPAGLIISVNKSVRHAADGLHFLPNPAEFITGILHVKHWRPAHTGGVLAELTKRAVCPRVSHST